MLILLDIDGVMVPASPWKKPEFLEDNFPAFSYRAIKALQKIISVTSADILLTTSHKSKYSLYEWENIFNLRGIKIENISSLPENSNNLNRKEEILSWVNNQIFLPEIIIIDDDKSLNGLPSFLKEKLIQPSGTIGLTEDLVDEALLKQKKILQII